ncbi:MAG: COX15/CtaA family protein [Nitrososphaerota archaeon]
MSGAASARFGRLAEVAVGATFLLILVGGTVRLDDAGLGCGAAGSGLDGWPLCHSRLVPTDHSHTVVEYTHRALAALVVLLVAALLWQALRRLRAERLAVRGSALAVALVLFQAVLGGLTVEHGLGTALVAAHLGTAMLLLGTLVTLAVAARSAGRRRPASGVWPRALALFACVALLATIVAGGVIAGTEHRGVGGGESGGAHTACGTEFPTCNGALLPYGESAMVDVQLAHRTLMVAAVAAILALAFALYRRRLARRLAVALLLALAVQVLLGASNVWFGEHAGLILAHLAVAAVLWALVVTAATLSVTP